MKYFVYYLIWIVIKEIYRRVDLLKRFECGIVMCYKLNFFEKVLEGFLVNICYLSLICLKGIEFRFMWVVYKEVFKDIVMYFIDWGKCVLKF